MKCNDLLQRTSLLLLNWEYSLPDAPWKKDVFLVSHHNFIVWLCDWMLVVADRPARCACNDWHAAFFHELLTYDISMVWFQCLDCYAKLNRPGKCAHVSVGWPMFHLKWSVELFSHIQGGWGYFLIKGLWGCAAGWGRIFMTGLSIVGLRFQ